MADDSSDEFMRREFPLSAQDFVFLRDFAEAQVGVVLSLDKREMIYSRLARRLRSLGLADFAAYCRLLARAQSAEVAYFIHAITTHLTAFFREAYHFDFLLETAFPQIEKSMATGRRLRLWSAACASGEEAYSLAMTVHEYGRFANWDVRILATDVDTEMLTQACAGIYGADRVSGMSVERQRRFFARLDDGRYRVTDELLAMVSFRLFNLIQPCAAGEFHDIIFCRNVMIYFAESHRRALIARFASMQRPGAYLMLGHAETLEQGGAQFYDTCGRTIHRRQGEQ